MLPDVFAKVLVGALLAGVVLVPLAGLVAVGWRMAGWRGATWMAVGVAAVPMFLFGVVYFVGLVIALVLIVVSAALSRWRHPLVDQAIPGIFVALHVAILTSALVEKGITRGGVLLAFVLTASSLSAFLATAKLGRMFGRAAFWPEARANRTEVPAGVTSRWR